MSSPYLLTATKTGYFAVENADDTPITEAGCGERAQFVWMLARHGTRNPSSAAISSMQRLLPKIRDQIIGNYQQGDNAMSLRNVECNDSGRGSLCDQDILNLEMWNFTLTEDDDSLLTESGEDEMSGLGGRWRNRLGSININVTQEFGFTDTQRTKESARNFAEGYTGNIVEDEMLPEPLQNQVVLSCDVRLHLSVMYVGTVELLVRV